MRYISIGKIGLKDRVKVAVIEGGCHCVFKTFHRCFVNIYRYDFKSPARDGDLKSTSSLHIVTSILDNDSFFYSSLFCFNTTNTSIRSFIFSLLKTFIYIYIKGPFLSFSQEPHTSSIRPCCHQCNVHYESSCVAQQINLASPKDGRISHTTCDGSCWFSEM